MGLIDERSGYSYWGVECESCGEPIPLRRYLRLQLTWPDQFGVKCKNPECNAYHDVYIHQEIRRYSFSSWIPLKELPIPKAVEKKSLALQESIF